MAEKITRRDFLRKSAVGLAGLTVVPSAVLGKSEGHVQPSDKLNIAGIGIGGKGSSDLSAVSRTENIVALADVDWKYAANTFGRYPDAKKYWDYRKMYDELGKSIDAVMVATPDHTHAIVAADAISMGKHAFVQKPLTHTVYESRLLSKLADKYKVATQMGNQGSSGPGVNQICDWIWAGEIGEVTRVEAWTNRPIWPQGLNTPTVVDPIPDTLNWDLFIGPAPMRAFNAIYHPWNWRGWWDFGTGALGDMACHILHPVFKALALGYPTKAQGSSTMLMTDSAPSAQIAHLTYPARARKFNVNLPEVKITWFDGGVMPARPAGMPDGKQIGDGDGGVIFHGTKDTLICGCYAKDPWLLSGRTPNSPARNRAVPNGMNGHQMDWVRACKESPATRVPAASDFAEAGPFNEMVAMGVLAVRLQSLRKELLWDGANMRFTNIGPDETIRFVIEDKFSISEGHPTFAKVQSDPVNAQQFAAQLIKHNYRQGWKLVDMP